MRRSYGIDWVGGVVIGPRLTSFAVSIVDSRQISVTGVNISGPKVGVAITRSSDIDVVGNTFDGVRSDGVNIAMSRRVRITGNACLNFKPIRAIYSSDGRLLVDGDHSDCIQGWSRRGQRPTSDITISDNVAEGEMQGISFFDSGEGGYDRIVIRNNDLNLSYWNGIVIYEGRGSIVTGNRVRTIAGARARNWPFQSIRTWIYVTGTRNHVCGNFVEAIPDGEGTRPC
jgi:nitrous oxidase accessory protein NosD